MTLFDFLIQCDVWQFTGLIMFMLAASFFVSMILTVTLKTILVFNKSLKSNSSLHRRQ